MERLVRIVIAAVGVFLLGACISAPSLGGTTPLQITTLAALLAGWLGFAAGYLSPPEAASRADTSGQGRCPALGGIVQCL